MKKILILGAAKNQVPLILAAKAENYYVIVCDWTNDNPGLPYVDKHYRVSTMDRDAVMDVAIQEHIDGVISNSEPAMENVAYISEKLGLVGNSLNTLQILLSKDKFRSFQESIGIYAPKHYVFDKFDDYLETAKQMKVPFIVKPVENSGSRGTTKIERIDAEYLLKAFNENVAFSRNKHCSIEEYVEMPSLNVIDGDIFVHNGIILWNGMFLSTRSKFNPLVPMTQSYPLVLSDGEMKTVKDTLSKIVVKSGIKHGEYNIEAYYTKKGELFIIEINPRQGGNSIPEMIQAHSGVDMYKLLVTTAVRDDEYFENILKSGYSCNYISRFPVFSHKDGIYCGLFIDDSIKKYVVSIEELKQKGEPINMCRNATDVVGFVNLEFESYNVQCKICDQLEEKIYPIVRK